MLIDGVQLAEGSDFANATIDSGTSFPANPDAGELFFRSDLETLHYYNGSDWLEIATGTSATGSTGTGDVVYRTSPNFQGFPTSTTPSVNDSSTVIATTAFVKAVVAAIPAAPAVPYDISGSILSKPTASAVVMRFVANRGFTIPTGFTNSIARTNVAPTAQYVLSVQKNGTQVGTITFAAAATTGTFSGGGTFASGDVLTVVAPGTADATFTDATFTIAATLA